MQLEHLVMHFDYICFAFKFRYARRAIQDGTLLKLSYQYNN